VLVPVKKPLFEVPVALPDADAEADAGLKYPDGRKVLAVVLASWTISSSEPLTYPKARTVADAPEPWVMVWPGVRVTEPRTRAVGCEAAEPVAVPVRGGGVERVRPAMVRGL